MCVIATAYVAPLALRDVKGPFQRTPRVETNCIKINVLVDPTCYFAALVYIMHTKILAYSSFSTVRLK